ncbi:MAG TPA: hypothetical protein VJ746_16365 [Nitrospira sp.]|nr:hypothetical protein [Nitrospira sp.]
MWKALTERFERCSFNVEKIEHKLEELLSWFFQAMGPTMAALYCAAWSGLSDESDRLGLAALEAVSLSVDEKAASSASHGLMHLVSHLATVARKAQE